MPLTLGELESYLAKAADLLRGSIDQADFKAYIFPLMFFKRISDVYDEEYARALDESGGDHTYAAFEENHRFTIPDGCHWADVRERTENVGEALKTAFRGIEQANQGTLYGIFGGATWTNKDKLPDSKLIDLIEHFSIKDLSISHAAPDVLGQAYEYLIKRFADQSNKKAGEYYTPPRRFAPPPPMTRSQVRSVLGRDAPDIAAVGVLGKGGISNIAVLRDQLGPAIEAAQRRIRGGREASRSADP
ncbi:type I restriction-modification system subunit M N-terminal domain-containing protein [Streptomyces anulatus]